MTYGVNIVAIKSDTTEKPLKVTISDGGTSGEFVFVMNARRSYLMRLRKTALDIGIEMLIMIDVSLPDKSIDRIYAVRDGHICSIEKHSEDKTIREVIKEIIKKDEDDNNMGY